MWACKGHIYLNIYALCMWACIVHTYLNIYALYMPTCIGHTYLDIYAHTCPHVSQALTLFSLKLLRGCVRMGTSHTFTIKHISGYGRGIVYSTFPLRSLLIIYRGNVRFKRSSYISQNG